MKNTIILSAAVITIFITSGCGNRAPESASFEPEDMAEDMNSMLSNELVTVQSQDNANMASSAESEAPAWDPSAPFVKPTNEEIQQSLKNTGLYTGKVDGVVGPRTKKAIRDFQAQNDLNADGRIGPQTWSKLGPYLHQAADTAASAGTPQVDN